MTEIPIIGQQPKRVMSGVRVEIARSFTLKTNLGDYESFDAFASQKSECAIEDAEEVSAALYRFCKAEVLKAVNEFKASRTLSQRGNVA